MLIDGVGCREVEVGAKSPLDSSQSLPALVIPQIVHHPRSRVTILGNGGAERDYALGAQEGLGTVQFFWEIGFRCKVSKSRRVTCLRRLTFRPLFLQALASTRKNLLNQFYGLSTLDQNRSRSDRDSEHPQCTLKTIPPPHFRYHVTND